MSVLAIIDSIPTAISQMAVLNFIRTQNVNRRHVIALKEYANVNDDLISDWLNISVKTFRNYKNQNIELKANIKEHIVLLLSLFKHGIEVFGSQENFNEWLNTPNFFLDKELPINYLNTITGIRFIEDRLTAMEYGDNV